jgi:hypothetical protein
VGVLFFILSLHLLISVIFSILNLTDVNYNGGAYGNSDNISVGIVKLRDL